LLDEPVAGIDDVLVVSIREALTEAAAGGRFVLLAAHEHDLKRLGLDDRSPAIRLASERRVESEEV